MGKTKINLKRKEPAIILLDILLKGYPVRKDGLTYKLSEDNYLCQEAISRNPSSKTKRIVLLKIGLGYYGLKGFIEWANTFTTDELTINGANSVLNDLKRGK